MEWVKSSLLWCCPALCTAHFPQRWGSTTAPPGVGAPWCSQWRAHQRVWSGSRHSSPEPLPQNHQNTTKIEPRCHCHLLVLQPRSPRRPRGMRGCVNAKGILQLFIGKILVQIFTTTKIHDKNTKHRSQTESQYQQLINTMRYFSIRLILYTVTRDDQGTRYRTLR